MSREVTGKDGRSGQAVDQYIAAYDPQGGTITGAGRIVGISAGQPAAAI